MFRNQIDPSCLTNRLSTDEREFFETNRYLVIENALDEAFANRLIEVVDRVDAHERTAEQAGKLLSRPDVVHEDPAMVELLDWPAVFPKIWGILGWNICLYHSHLDVTPNESARVQGWNVAWHQNSMRVNDEIESNPRPRLSLKIGYYLTDVSEPGRGNTLILPGSHLQNEIVLVGLQSRAGVQRETIAMDSRQGVQSQADLVGVFLNFRPLPWQARKSRVLPCQIVSSPNSRRMLGICRHDSPRGV